MSMGFLAELITAYQSREEDTYSIVDETAATTPVPPTPVSHARGENS
jgi:hypothetical protein